MLKILLIIYLTIALANILGLILLIYCINKEEKDNPNIKKTTATADFSAIVLKIFTFGKYVIISFIPILNFFILCYLLRHWDLLIKLSVAIDEAEGDLEKI